MTVLVVYATNSGATYLVAERIEKILTSLGHLVSLVDIKDLDESTLKNYSLIFFGSNSWDWQGLEGQPHHKFMEFVERVKKIDCPNSQFFLFGCGDKTYQYFCGALDVIEKFLKDSGCNVNQPVLKIDRFYFNDQNQIFSQVEDWLNNFEIL